MIESQLFAISNQFVVWISVEKLGDETLSASIEPFFLFHLFIYLFCHQYSLSLGETQNQDFFLKQHLYERCKQKVQASTTVSTTGG